MNTKTINHTIEYLDYCHNIVDKLSKGESLLINLNMNGFCQTLHQLIQLYYSSDLSQREEIRQILKRSVAIIWTYLMPLNASEEDSSILPVAFEGDYITTNNIISLYEGELQLAMLLVKIAILLEDECLLKKANLIASFSKIKEDRFKENDLTFDLKSGTIGIALLYQTIYFLTNEKLYLERANYWFEKSEKLKQLFLKEKNTSIEQIDQETILAFEAFSNPQDSFWRRFYFLEFDTFLKSDTKSKNVY
ncbi:hypothetical protein [Arcicella rosea]|uniref:Lanthionine synthetase C-like protein n=1 Tax=Arcicella rosea TaxID=502909 RepID=A0A841EM62_9BACT|nr:hypothetical protein [Arcicella rosea]MBB6002509.1 hypothetical protein [Arcicella rosea]